MAGGEKFRILLEVLAARRRDRWSPERLAAHQRSGLARLVRWAQRRSPHYARALQGLEGAPLAELPILTKRDLIQHWDEIVTAPALTRDEALAFAAQKSRPDALWRGRYQVMTTSGTSGLKAPFVYGPGEWAKVMASLARTGAWREFGPSAKRPLAMVTLGSGAHMAARMAATLRGMFSHVTQVNAAASTAEQVEALNRAQPAILAGYPSALAVLAEEQAAGRLRISPQMINASSEVLTPAVRDRIAEVFGVEPYNNYATTETGIVGAACRERRGLHLQEDMTLLEVVDEEGRAVAPGAFGARVLATVLWSRTLPLVRYEITDRFRLAETACPCGLPFRLVEEVDGRSGDVLSLPGRAGVVRLAPSAVQGLLAGWPIVRWQVAHGAGRFELRVAPRDGTLEAERLRAAVCEGLAALGVTGLSPTVTVMPVIPPTASGKVPLFVKLEP